MIDESEGEKKAAVLAKESEQPLFNSSSLKKGESANASPII
jgi:hypothetical protein